MKPLGNAREHFWLMTGMAKALDVDLGAAMAEGRLSRADYAAMVTACRGCTGAGACRKVLDAVESLPEAPGYCVNRETLPALALG